MLWLWLSTGLSTIAVALAAVAVFGARRALASAQARLSESVALHRIEELRNEVANLTELQEHQGKLYRRLTARTSKRRQQEEPPPEKPPETPQPEHDLPLASGEPSPYTDPEGWKKWKRAQIAQSRLRGV